MRINYPEIARKWVKESKRYNQTVMANSVPITKKEPKMAKSKNNVYKNILNKKVSKKNNKVNVFGEGHYKMAEEDVKKLKSFPGAGKKEGRPGSDVTDIVRNLSKLKHYSKKWRGTGEVTYKPKRKAYTGKSQDAIDKIDWGKQKKKKVSKKNNKAKVKVEKENGKTKTTTTNVGTVSQTGKVISSPTTSKDGVYTTKKRIQVHTPEGKRWYEGTGTSRSRILSHDKAKHDARIKPVTDPADSLVTGGVDPVFPPPETKKKKKKKDKKRFWQLKK